MQRLSQRIAPSSNHPGIASARVERAGISNDAPSRRLLSEDCRRARAMASQMLATACATNGGQSAFARMVGVHHSHVGRWVSTDEPDSICLGDLLLGGRIGRDVLTAALSYLDDEAPLLRMPPERHGRRLAHLVGELEGAIDAALLDNAWSDDEERDIERRFLLLAGAVSRALADLRARRK